jgi:hypothetical protein
LIVPDARIVATRNPYGKTAKTPGSVMIAEPIPVIETVDQEVHEPRLEIRDRVDRSVVAVIELMSPTNKVAGSKDAPVSCRPRWSRFTPAEETIWIWTMLVIRFSVCLL